MYLKRLEIVGFKSFANKTRLEFEPGMTAIVGPNGCGKSNVSDAVRWVLGEQRARALRGAKMEDVIFNGTDTQKALGMAEVSITLADCSESLGVEFEEVCVTRRVFRSGESGYFLNRKACRLKDIQRLFMDTGVGTDSYSILEQGKIDQILSSRPEDRRMVFEEASGITKYKADKKEALRKLEHTEANLLRLEDVIREVKRQIGSLQRQAGKARRYKQMAAELRSLDLYATRSRLKEFAKKINGLTGELQIVERTLRERHEAVEKAEAQAKDSRAALTRMEETISRAMEEASAARGELERAQSRIAMNADRITELTSLAQRNAQETEEAKERLGKHRKEYENLVKEIAKAKEEKEAADIALKEALATQKEAEEQMHSARSSLNKLRNESLAADARVAKLQNELNQIDARDRSALIKRERLIAEKAELERALVAFEKRMAQMKEAIAACTQQLEAQTQRLEELQLDRATRRERIAQKSKQLNELKQRHSSLRGQLDMLSGEGSRQAGFPPGAQALLSKKKRPQTLELLGPLVEQLSAPEKYQTALESVLRPLLDALLCPTETAARKALEWVQTETAGSVRLLAQQLTQPPSKTAPLPKWGEPLLEKLSYPEDSAELMQRLFGHVCVVESLAEIPEKIPPEIVVITLDGTLLSGSGQMELWMPGKKDRTPLARHQLRKRLKKEAEETAEQIQELEETLSALNREESGMAEAIGEERKKLEDLRRERALKEGEQQVILRETKTARDRVETVSFEVETLMKNENQGTELRSRLAQELQETRDRIVQLRAEIAEQTRLLTQREEERADTLSIASEHRIIFSRKTQALEHLLNRKTPLEARIRELEELIEERTRGINSYQRRIEELKKSTQTEKEKILPLEERLKTTAETLERERARREELLQTLSGAENHLRTLRDSMEEELRKKSQLEVEIAEYVMRRDNALERVSSAYHLTKEELDREPDPEWEDGTAPSADFIETRIAELRTKLDAMGPVNLVAIEEHAELEERFAFLKQQQSDLVAAKQQLLEMIKTINATTTQLFRTTFDQVNTHFQHMFKRLFGGGTAKLVLTNDEDILEAGIEIIARPPGKKLQTISLLSGGERTMTAVALLFSLFLVKPSPFCVLDELDAALDDANINRFVDTLKDFLQHSQFIIITHSRQTIAAADVIYGVTMEKRGVSKIVSMKFADYRDEKK